MGVGDNLDKNNYRERAPWGDYVHRAGSDRVYVHFTASHAERRRRLAAREAAGGRLGDDGASHGGGLRSDFGHDFATCAAAAVVMASFTNASAFSVVASCAPAGPKVGNFLFVARAAFSCAEKRWARSPESSVLGRTSDPISYAGAGGSDFNSQLFAGFLVSYRPLAFQQLTRTSRRDLHGIPQFKLALVE